MNEYFIKELSTGAVSETVTLPPMFIEDLIRALWETDFVVIKIVT